jgi:lambda family phage tail tape measure protein
MTTDSRKLVVAPVVDATGAKAGFKEIEDSSKHMAQVVSKSGQEASKGLDGVGDGAKTTADAFTREEGRLRASILRSTFDLKTLGKTASEKIEAKIELQGLDGAKFQPYITQLKALEAQQKTLGVSAGQTANAFRTLPAQFTDIATQLAGGQSPFLILLQQGGQIKDSFGGIGNAAKALASLITPTTVAIGGMVAAFGGLALAVTHAEKLQQSLNTLEIQLTATGRAGLISSGDLKKFIEQLARAPGVTRDSATAIVNEFTKIHNIGGALFKDLAASTADYARATGTDLPTAAKTLAKAFEDPIKGAKTLDDALGTLSSTQLLQIENLTKQNDLVGAQRVLYDALQQSVKGLATDALTPLQKATNDLGNAWEKANGELSKSDGIRTVNALLVQTVGLVTYLVSNAGKLGGLGNIATGLLPGGAGLGAVANGAGAFLRNQLGIKPLFGSGGGEQGAGATQAQARAVDNAVARAAATADQDEVKRALELGKAYQGQSEKIKELTTTRNTLTAAMRKSVDPAVIEKLKGQIAGVDEAIEAAKKRQAGPAPKAYQDDAATKMLENLRQQEASLNEQLATDVKLTASEKERAKFVQLVSDLKTKGTLTADQKSLLASQDAIKAQLDKNVAVEKELELKKEAAKETERLAQLDKQFAERSRQRTEAITSSLDSQGDQYDRVRATIGLGARARQEVEAQRSIFREYNKMQLDLVKNTPEHLLGSDKYKEEAAKIKEGLNAALDAQKQFFADEKAAREDWSTGAKSALADYVDYVNDAAGRARSLLTNSLTGFTDSVTEAIFGDKGASFKQLGENIAKQITKGIVEQQITKPIAEWLQGAVSDKDSIFSKLFGGLTSNKETGENWLGMLGLGGGGKAGSAATARGSTMGNPLYVQAVGGSFGSAANDSSSGGGGILGMLGGLFGGGSSNSAATAAANAMPGDALDNLINLQGGWGTMLGFANGGDPPVGRVSMVGERGPELFIPRQAGTIIPNNVLRGGGGGGGNVINLNFQPGQVDQRTGTQISNDVSLSLRRAGRMK